MRLTISRGFASAGLCVALTAGSAQADLLGLNLQLPDIFSSFIDVIYDADLDMLTASGFALEFDLDGTASPLLISGGTLDLTAPIDDSATLGAGGTLVIGGTIASLGFTSGTLLSATLTDFGFRPSPGGNPLEFIFDVIGGDAAGLYGSSPGGIVLGGTAFGGSFAADFDNLLGGPGTGWGSADVAPVPAPSAMVLALVGMSAVGWLKRR